MAASAAQVRQVRFFPRGARMTGAGFMPSAQSAHGSLHGGDDQFAADEGERGIERRPAAVGPAERSERTPCKPPQGRRLKNSNPLTEMDSDRYRNSQLIRSFQGQRISNTQVFGLKTLLDSNK